jgi:hypothetical protein
MIKAKVVLSLCITLFCILLNDWYGHVKFCYRQLILLVSEIRRNIICRANVTLKLLND